MGFLDKVKEKIAPINEVLAPGVNPIIDAASGKKKPGDAIVDASQEILLPGSKQAMGNASDRIFGGGVKPFTPGDPRNQWQGMQQSAKNMYDQASFGYNPYETAAVPELQTMDFNPYASGQLNQAAAQAGGGYQSLISDLEQSGGLSGADRIQAIRNFNRQKVMGSLGTGAAANKLQSQNQLDVGRYNLGRSLDAQKQTVGAQNDASRQLAQANQQRDLNLYESGLDSRNLTRQLEASSLIGNASRKQGGNGVLDQLFGALGKSF